MYNVDDYEWQQENEENEEIDLDYFGELRYAGKELVRQGKTIGHPFPAYAWDYLVASSLITINNESFRKEVKGFYESMYKAEAENNPDFIPSVLELADTIDEYNTIVIFEFYKKNGYSPEDIEVIIGNYIQEYSCLMEDWAEEVLREQGLPYYGSAVMRYHDLREDYAPQNILLVEFLR